MASGWAILRSTGVPSSLDLRNVSTDEMASKMDFTNYFFLLITLVSLADKNCSGEVRTKFVQFSKLVSLSPNLIFLLLQFKRDSTPPTISKLHSHLSIQLFACHRNRYKHTFTTIWDLGVGVKVMTYLLCLAGLDEVIQRMILNLAESG